MYKKIIPFIFWFYTSLLLMATIVPYGSINQNVGMGSFSFRLDHIFHSLVYFGFTTLFYLLHSSKLNGNNKILVFWKSSWIILIAFGTEMLQHFIPSRNFSLNDFAANVLGILIAYISCFIFRNSLSRILSNNLKIY